MIREIVVFVMGLVCGYAANHIRIRLMRKKVRLYESYIHGRLAETVPFINERITSREVKPGPASGPPPEAGCL